MMAPVEAFEPRQGRSPKRHAPAEAGFRIFEVEGQTHLQIVTCRSSARQVKGAVSQTIPFGPDGIAAPRETLKSLP